MEPIHPIETERLRLRPFEPGDLDVLFAVHSRPDVARYLYWEPRTKAEARAALDNRIHSRPCGRRATRCAWR